MRSRFAATILIAVLASSGAAAWPRVMAATRSDCGAAQHDCHQAVLECCCDDAAPDSQQPSAPPSCRVIVASLELSASPAALCTQPARALTLSALLRHPPHGYPRADLRLLLSVFLI